MQLLKADPPIYSTLLKLIFLREGQLSNALLPIYFMKDAYNDVNELQYLKASSPMKETLYIYIDYNESHPVKAPFGIIVKYLK